MWQIYEHRRISKSIRKIPREVLQRYEKWKDIVRLSGPQGLRMIKGFHDEVLQGEWKGYRSSPLGLQFRVIYKVENEKMWVMVLNLTPHDYRKR